MKTFLGYTRQAAMPVVVLLVVAFVWASTGCTGSQVQIKPVQDPAVIGAVLREAGSSLVYFGLKGEDEDTIERVAEVISGIRKTLSEKTVDLVALAPQIVSRLTAEMDLYDDYEYLAGRAANLLTMLVQVNVTIPENYQTAMDGISAFLAGAEEGLQSLRKARR